MIPLILNEAIPRQIITLPKIVGEAVYFHDQSFGPARKIHEIRSDLKLLGETAAVKLACIEVAPKSMFSGRGFASKGA